MYGNSTDHPESGDDHQREMDSLMLVSHVSSDRLLGLVGR